MSAPENIATDRTVSSNLRAKLREPAVCLSFQATGHAAWSTTIWPFGWSKTFQNQTSLPKCMAAAVVSLPFSTAWPALRRYYHLRREARCHLFQFNNLQPTFNYITNVYKCHVYLVYLCFGIGKFIMTLTIHTHRFVMVCAYLEKIWKACVRFLCVCVRTMFIVDIRLACCDMCHVQLYLQM